MIVRKRKGCTRKEKMHKTIRKGSASSRREEGRLRKKCKKNASSIQKGVNGKVLKRKKVLLKGVETGKNGLSSTQEKKKKGFSTSAKGRGEKKAPRFTREKKEAERGRAFAKRERLCGGEKIKHAPPLFRRGTTARGEKKRADLL